MSHFSVAVITKTEDKKEITHLLAPYQENNNLDCPKEYLEFFDIDEELRDRYENENNSIKKRYPTFEKYMNHYGYKKNEYTGRYGYYENPNAKWDWYAIGGRFDYDDGFGYFTKLKDLDLNPVESEYNEALRYWEVVVEGSPIREDEDENWFFSIYKTEYYTEQFKTKENYALDCSTFSTWAMVTPDGEWYENGKMGWFAMSDATMESRNNFKRFFYDYLKNPENSEYFLTIVDCHI